MRHTPRRPSGFTLVELIILMGLIGIVAFIGLPAFLETLRRSQLESAAQELSVFLRQARFESIRRGAPAVVRLNVATRELTAFIDIHDGLGTPNPDLVFNPQPGLGRGATDYTFATHLLPARLILAGPPGDPAPIVGFTDPGDGPRAVFNADGSAAATGALRIGDDRGNILEIGVEPAATARIQLRKWHQADSAWYTRDMRSNQATWEWY